MSDNVIKDRLELILESIEIILERMKRIPNERFLIESDEGKMYMDGLALRLQVIGENVKKIKKVNPSFFEKYPGTDWQPIIQFRDLISHHYEKADFEIIYNICKYHIPPLKNAINKIISDLH